MRRLALSLLAAVPVLLAGCGVLHNLSDSRQYESSGLMGAAREAQQAARTSAKAEEAIGREAAANLAAKYGLSDDDDLLRYVNLVGQAVARKAARPGIRYRFGILDAKEPNAYAAPGGYVFVTRGLLDMLEDEAELAGVLAHEVQHVARRHALKALRRGRVLRAGADLLTGDEDIGEAARVTIGTLERGYDRADELDADKEGVRCLAAAGYDPSGLPRALERHVLLSGDLSDPFSQRHPPFQDRIRALADIRTPLPEKGAVLQERFSRSKRG